MLRHGRGQDAIAVVARARSALGDADGLEVERRWKTVVDGGDADAETRSAAREDDRHVMAHVVGEDADLRVNGPTDGYGSPAAMQLWHV